VLGRLHNAKCAPEGLAGHEWKAVLVATVENMLKQKLEHLLGMSGGYVLDYSNASFADFVRNSIGIDPYALHDGSKAQVLRNLWLTGSSNLRGNDTIL